MAQKTNLAMNRLVAERDRAFDQMEFNNQYPAVFETIIDKKTEKARHSLMLASQKRLYQLEMAAMPAAVVNKELYIIELEKFTQKQVMPRRAIEQSALRLEKKSGKEAGEQYRKDKLGALDKKLADYEAALLLKYPKTDQPVSQEAVAKYEAAQKEEAEKLAAFDAKCAADKKDSLEKLTQSLALKNKKLEDVFSSTNQQLRELNSSVSAAVDKDTVLSLKNVKMYFSGIKAVDDLSFDIKRGEIFGLIGPNGAGKSTLFNCITQFYKPQEGQIYYRDKFDNVVSLTDYRAHDVVKTGIARTFQNLELVWGLSILDNLLVGAHVYYRSNLADQFLHTKKMKDEEEVTRAFALEVLDRLQLLPYKDLPPVGLPYGILKKIELARTLMTKPRLIILDEPAAGLNDAETEELAEVIRRIRDDYDCTIFLVEHDMNLVMGVCDTVCAISFGQMLAIGTPEEIQESPLVQEAYLGEKEEDV